MKTKRVEQIIREIRRRSNNIEWGSNSGITDETIANILNGAKDRLQALILQTDATAFREDFDFNTVSNQQVYDLPIDMLDSGGLVTLDVKLGDRWVPLLPKILKERSDGDTGCPFSYIRNGRKLLLNPTPQSSEYEIRGTYIKRLNDLSPILGKIVNSEAGILFPPNTAGSDMDVYKRELYEFYDYVSILDSQGVILNTLKYTFDTDGADLQFVLVDDTTDYSDYIGLDFTLGEGASNYLFDVDPVMTEYLIQYGSDYLNIIDSNGDVEVTSKKLSELESQILSSYEVENEDIILVPDLNRRGY